MPKPVGLGTAGELCQRLPECWSGMKKSESKAPEPETDKKTSKTGLASLEPTGGFFFFFK